MEENGDSVFSMFLEELNQNGSVIQIEKMTQDQASEKLTAREIQGILLKEKRLIYRCQEAEWLRASLQSLLESYLNGKHIMETVARTHPENLQQAADALSDYQELVQNVLLRGRTTNGNAGFFVP